MRQLSSNSLYLLTILFDHWLDTIDFRTEQVVVVSIKLSL